MPVPSTSGNFGDLLDPRFQRIFNETYKQLPDMNPSLYTFVPTNNRNDMRWTQVGTVANLTQFAGTVTYQSQNQGFDTTATPVEFASGIQVERTLFDDDQYNVMNQRPRALANSTFRTRQTHGARVLNNGFSVDNFFYNNSEAVALFSNSHTTTSGASTATGFDNLVTSALTAAAVAAARIQHVNLRGDQAERISIQPNEIFIPQDLYEEAFEITASSDKVDTANNNRNVHEGQYKIVEMPYLTDVNNWVLSDSAARGQSVFWTDRITPEFAMVEDFDTLTAKWRVYGRWANAHTDWRWAVGANVS